MTTNAFRHYLQSLDVSTSAASRISLWLILLLGLGLRLYWLYAGDAYHYLAINDEITAYDFALRFLAGETSAWYLGQPDFAGGKAPGPWFTVFWVASYLLGGSTPTGALLVVAILTTAAIVLVYRLAAPFLDNRYALLTALLFACAPWVVYYAVTLWNPTPLVILGAALCLALWQTVNNERSRAVFWVCIVLALIPHFHMIGLFYAPAVLLVLYAMPARLNIKWFIAGIFAGIALYLPYLIGDALHGWHNTRAILSGGGAGDGFSPSVFKILTAPATVLSNLPSRWVGPEFSQYLAFGDAYFGSYVVLLAINLVSILFGFYVVYAFATAFVRLLWRERLSLRQAFAAQPDVVFIALLLFVPLLLFLLTGHNYATRYTIIIFPLLFILLARRMHKLLQSHPAGWLRGAIAFMVIANSYVCITFFHYTGRMLDAGQQFMPSFAKLEEVRRGLSATVEGVPVIRLAHGTKTLSELDRTLLTALPAYIDIHYRYVEPGTERERIPLLLAPAEADVARQEVVYRGNGILVTRNASRAIR